MRETCFSRISGDFSVVVLAAASNVNRVASIRERNIICRVWYGVSLLHTKRHWNAVPYTNFQDG